MTNLATEATTSLVGGTAGDAMSAELEPNADTSVTSFPLLKLPAELRRMVYRKALLCSKPISMATNPENERPSSQPTKLGVFVPVLRVCRQVSEEAQDVLYGENTFEYITEFSPFTNLPFPAKHRRRIRKVACTWEWHPFSQFPEQMSGVLHFCLFARVLASTRPSRHYTRDFHLTGQTTPVSLAGSPRQAQEHHVP